MSPRRPEISADDLRSLIAVARSGRLVSAAASLGVDHTTVRRRLDRLEAALGGRLLDRSSEGWELTPLGRDIAARAAPLEELLEQVVTVASGGVEQVRGTVRVLAPEGFAVTFGAPALARLRQEHPGVQVELVTSTRPLSVRSAGFDLAVAIGAHSGVGLTSELLADYALRLYASADYLASHPPIHAVDDLADHDLVFYVDALLAVRDLDLAPLLGGMAIGFGSTSVVAQLEATRRGAGVGLLHAFMAESAPGLVPVLPREVDFRLQFTLSTRRESRSVAAVVAVRAALLREVGERGGELVPPTT